jgi:pimeloyl-ACP methyl ester carboxylesterase
MAGKRELLKTHGVLSSLEGAFAGIKDPNGAVMQHLRGIYGDNIIGWDHWTIGKTPLENAEEMLSALAPGVRPDIVSHSRGGLVTRAMLEHPDLIVKRQSRFGSVGKAIFVAGACQGSQLATLNNVNRLLNIYAAVASFPFLGGVGVALKVIVGVLRVLAHGATRLPSIEALSADLANNPFLVALNESHMTPTGEIVVLHANYDPTKGVLARFLDLNVDLVFNQANDMVVPFLGAETFDKWQQVGTNIHYGTPSQRQGVVMHTNFFIQPGVHDLLQEELTA